FINPKSKILEKMEEIKGLIDEHDLELNDKTGQEIRINGELVQEWGAGMNKRLTDTKDEVVELYFTELAICMYRLMFDLQTKCNSVCTGRVFFYRTGELYGEIVLRFADERLHTTDCTP